MPVNVGKINSGNTVKIFSSPVAELLAAVHFLSEEKHHSADDSWTPEMLSRLTERSRKTLNFLGGQNWAGMAHFDYLLVLDEFNDIDVFIERFDALSVDDFLFITFNQETPKERIFSIRNEEDLFEGFYNSLSWLVGGEYKTIHKVLYNAEEYKDNLSVLFRELNCEFFSGKIAGFTDLYRGAAGRVQDLLVSKTPLEVVSEIKGINVNEDKFENFLFVPCFFLHIHNLICTADDTILLLFSVERFFHSSRVKAEQYAEHLKAFSDKTRLEILRILCVNPSYGKKIAEMLQLTGATVSRHLNILKTNGFIKEERREGVKYFSCNTEYIRKIFAEVNDFLSPRNSE